jgi:hypothetical protein
VSCLVNKCSIADAASDIGGGLGPAKRFGVIIPVAEPVHDRGFETADAIEAAAANSMAGNYCAPAFNEVEPRRAARRKVQMDSGMGSEPFIYGTARTPMPRRLAADQSVGVERSHNGAGLIQPGSPGHIVCSVLR